MKCSCFIDDGRNCIERVPIFSNLTTEEMLEIASITSEKTFEKGEMIYMAGDSSDNLYVIHKGKVKITRLTESGKEQVIRILGPGEFLGELSLFSSVAMTDNGEAIEKVTMCMISGEKLKALMTRYPSITFKIMEELSMRLEKAENTIENISLHSVERRIALNLLDLSEEGKPLKLNMSKGDWASQLGMSQETLSRKLSAFQELGIIKLIGHRGIEILKREVLEGIE
jgi:CRP/FNR family transcriptional regulator